MNKNLDRWKPSAGELKGAELKVNAAAWVKYRRGQKAPEWMEAYLALVNCWLLHTVGAVSHHSSFLALIVAGAFL